MEGAYPIQVKSLIGGISVALDVTAAEKITVVKEQVAAQANISVPGQTLIYLGTTLEDTKTIGEYQIPPGATIHLVVNPGLGKPQTHLLYDISGSMDVAYKQTIVNLKKPNYDALKISTYNGCDFSDSLTSSMTGSVVAIVQKAAPYDEIHIISDFQDSVSSTVDNVLIPQLKSKNLKLFLHTVECTVNPALIRAVEASKGKIIKEN